MLQSSPPVNHQEVLQVPVGELDKKVLQRQYKRLALLLHPDKNKHPLAEEAFKLIGNAIR
jgi:curved DNA-binding protein CbpA